MPIFKYYTAQGCLAQGIAVLKIRNNGLNYRGLKLVLYALTDYDGDIPALIPEKYFLMVNFDAL